MLLDMVRLLLALALIPSGFDSHPELAARVQFIVDHPISVYCATSDDAWNQAQAEYGITDPGGFARVGGNEIFLAPVSCRQLLAKVSGKPFSWFQLASNLLAITHEAEHLAGHRDEHETDCAALSVLRQVAMNFGVRRPINLSRIIAYATTVHSVKPPAYSAPC
jgi:hypothetical protein